MCCIRISVQLYSAKILTPFHHMALSIARCVPHITGAESLCTVISSSRSSAEEAVFAFYFKILFVPSHPLQNVYMSTSMKRLFIDARPSNIRPFMDR
ncbi:hypothetical protein TNCV_1609421 [Trichonephila clavipes]|nr:hypothetical protein TNCV_1609421 [Trichonephila clavipes]